MKYYLLNRDDVKKNIWTNPLVIKTKSLGKIKKIRTLKKKLDTLMNQVQKELRESNIWSRATDDIIDKLLYGGTEVEITKHEFDALYALSLYDTQEQRIRFCNKTTVLKGRLFGNEIRD